MSNSGLDDYLCASSYKSKALKQRAIAHFNKR